MNKERLIKWFDVYCENKDCDRICPLERFQECFINFMIINFDIKEKGKN